MLNGWLLRLMFLPCCFGFNQKEVLDVREPHTFDGSWCYRTMLLLCFGSWCYWTFFLFVVLDVIEPCFILGSDVIELIVVGSDVIEPMIIGGFRRYHHAWCYWHYFRCNSGDLASTSSQICGSWNLPMFLLRDGSFTLMKIASLMFLAILLSSLPTILKLSRDTSWPVVFWWSMIGDCALMCSLNLSPKVLLMTLYFADRWW